MDNLLKDNTYYKDVFGFKIHCICHFTSSTKISYYVAIKSTSNITVNTVTSNVLSIKKHIDYYPLSTYSPTISNKEEFDSTIDIDDYKCDKVPFELNKYYQYKKTNDVIKVIHKHEEHFIIVEVIPSTIDINTLKTYNAQFDPYFYINIVTNDDNIINDDWVEVPRCVFLASMFKDPLYQIEILRYIKKMKINRIKHGI